MSEDPPRTASGEEDRPATFAGAWAVLATLSLFIVVPAIVFVAWTLMQRDFADVEHGPLQWKDRADWPVYDVKAKPLEHGVMSQARTGKTYKDLGFHPSEELLASIGRCRELAEREDFLTGEVHDALVAEWEAQGDQFYSAALLALWYADAAETLKDPLGAKAAEEWWTRAFAAAPAAVVQRVLTSADEPNPPTAVGTIAIAFDTVDETTDTISTDLVLVYPHVRTDAEGVWRLPIFKTIFRVIDPALGPPVPNDPLHSTWLTHVGQVGRLPAVGAK